MADGSTEDGQDEFVFADDASDYERRGGLPLYALAAQQPTPAASPEPTGRFSEAQLDVMRELNGVEPSDEQITKAITAHGTGGWQTPNGMLIFARAVLRLQAEEVVTPEMNDAQMLDWLEQHDGKFYNIDRVASIVGAGFLTGPPNTSQRHQNLRDAILALRGATPGP